MNVQLYSLIDKTEGEGRPVFDSAGRGNTLWDYPQEHLVVIRADKVSPVVKFKIILSFLWFLLDPFTNKRCRLWTSMINLWIDSRTRQKKIKNQKIRAFNMFWGIWCCHINHPLLESSSWFGLTKFFNYFFRSSHHVPEIYVLNIEENYLTW